jgi:NADH:ubiquinone oxidoreductase subunit E
MVRRYGRGRRGRLCRELPAITVCMGKSCYVRGNQVNLAVIESFLRERGLDVRVDVRGRRCGGDCALGPYVQIGDCAYGEVTPDRLRRLLRRYFGDRGES